MAILNLDGLTYFTTKIKQYIEDKILNKVDTVEGKGLSTNDLTDALKSNYDTAYTHTQSTHARTDATKVEKSSTNGNIKINGTEAVVYTHPSGTNPHGTTKSDVGLGNVDNTSDTNKPVSTAQQTAINNALSDAKEYTDNAISNEVTARNTAIDGAVIEANDYTDGAIADLINGAPTTLDTLGEIATAMSNNASVVEALDEAIGTKANASDLTSHTGNTTVHITATERTNWNDAKTHADSTHAPSNAEANQNAFSNVKVGSTTVVADSKTDTLELVAGTNVTITPDTTNDKITISSSWRGIQNNLSSASTTDSLSANQGKVLNDSKLGNGTALTNENLDDIKTPNLYFGAGGNTVANKPSGVEHFGLFVYKVASGYVAQELTYGTKVYYRYYNSTSWTTWTERKFTDTTYTHPSSGVTAGTYGSVTVNAQGHVTGGSNPTLSVAQGGTGATTAKGAEYNILSGVSETTVEVNDDSQIVFKYATPDVSKGILLFKKAPLLWDYIKGKADSIYAKVSHGNHVPATETANNAKFLRNDNTWQTVTPANIGALSTSGTAANASRLSNTSAIGSATKPVYFSADGVPVAGTYTLGAACAKGVTDSTSAGALSTGSNLVTERDVYYGTPKINGVKTYTSNTSIYAPTSTGTSGQVLKSTGNGAPVWSSDVLTSANFVLDGTTLNITT